MSGNGSFDLVAYNRYMAGDLEDYDYPEEAVRAIRDHIPAVKENDLLH
jgi:tryptophan synthase beta chain